MKSEKYYIFCISIIKSPKNNNQVPINQQFNQVTIIMRVHIGDNKLVVTAEPKSSNFDLPKLFSF